jgi:cyclic pyranopterin phosphate synthase
MSFSHFDDAGAARMVDVGQKEITARMARATARVRMQESTLDLVRNRAASKKGDVIEVARLAGIMAAKRTSDFIPLCHPLPLDSATVDFSFEAGALSIETVVRCTARTGVEMEALAAAAVAALTVYDMCKSVDRGMVIEEIRLEEKAGGRSGHFVR